MSDTATEEKETAEEVVNETLPDSTESVETEEQPQEETQEETSSEEKQEEHVPVSAHVAERKKRQEAEDRARWLEQQMMQQQQSSQPEKPQQDENDLLTVGQHKQTLQEWKRSVLEEAYMEQNPEVIERVKTELPSILEDPKHKWLADSISQAPNRLQRAAQVLDMFKPKKQAAPPPNREKTPKSPQSVAKTNKMSTADRLMSMSDQELEKWRAEQKRKVR